MPGARVAGLVALALAQISCGVSEIPTGMVDPNRMVDSGGAAGQGGSGGNGGNAGGGSGGAGGQGGAVGGSRDAGARADAAAPEGPATSGDGLVIGGVARPRDKVIVFLHIGHSNMAGRTNTPATLRPFNFETHPRLWTFTALGQWLPAKEPLSGDFLTRGRAGPGMSMLRTAMTLSSDAVMVSIGRGQDGSRGGACKGFRRGGLLYDTVMAPARQLKGKVTFGGIFSMLVLMEIFDKPNLPRSHECMEGVARDMREDLDDPNIPFIMSDWEMGATGRFDPALPDAVTARAQLRLAQQNIPRSVIVPTEMLPMSDDHHFDLTGYKQWAERAFGLMKQEGWLGWADSE